MTDKHHAHKLTACFYFNLNFSLFFEIYFLQIFKAQKVQKVLCPPRRPPLHAESRSRAGSFLADLKSVTVRNLIVVILVTLLLQLM